jgi:hypothetical protein
VNQRGGYADGDADRRRENDQAKLQPKAPRHRPSAIAPATQLSPL